MLIKVDVRIENEIFVRMSIEKSLERFSENISANLLQNIIHSRATFFVANTSGVNDAFSPSNTLSSLGENTPFQM